MHRFRIAVLRVLNQEDHQEGDDGRAGIDDQLPRVGVMKSRAGQRPNDDDERWPRQRPRRCRGPTMFCGRKCRRRLAPGRKSALIFRSLAVVFFTAALVGSRSKVPMRATKFDNAISAGALHLDLDDAWSADIAPDCERDLRNWGPRLRFSAPSARDRKFLSRGRDAASAIPALRLGRFSSSDRVVGAAIGGAVRCGFV